METLAVVSVSNIDPFVASDRMRIDHGSWMDAVLPFLLHLRVHNQQRIVRQVYRDLAFSVCPLILRATRLFVIPSNNFPYPEISSNTKTQAANDSSRPKVCQLITMIAYSWILAEETIEPMSFLLTYTFTTTLVAIDKSCIWKPFLRGLILELFAVRVVRYDAFSDLLINSWLNSIGNNSHLGCDLADILR